MSTWQMHSNRSVALAGRRATFAAALAVVGFTAGSSLAEATDATPAETSEPVAADATPIVEDEALVIELVIEAPPAETPPADDQPTDPPPTSEPATEPAPDELQLSAQLDETTTTTAPTEGEGGHDEGEGGHDEGEGGQGEGGSGGAGGHDEGEGGHDGGEGGSGGQGQGSPYAMTFSVDWQTEDGTAIPVLELPDDVRTLFELTAASRTGKNQPTSARCSYAESGDQLVCVFDNPGHRSETDGLIVPARPTATYSVTVVVDTADWTVEGANTDPFSARDLCPRGGGGGEEGGGGHDGGSGHDSGHDHESLTETAGDAAGGRTVVCNHRVVIQRIEVVPPEPEEPTDPTTPPTEPAQAALSPTAASAASTPRTLPATGTTPTTMLAIGAALAAIGTALALLARRTSTGPIAGPIGGPIEDRGRMPA